MIEYFVTWEINIKADSPEEAAKEALKIQRDENSIATVFYAFDGTRVCVVDLGEIKP